MAADGNPPWQQVPLGAVVSRCDYGLSCSLDGDATGIPVLRMGNLADGKVRVADLKYISTAKLPSEDDLLSPGDLLLNRTNSAERVGKVGLFEGGPRTTFASYLFRLRARQEEVSPEWLAQVLASPQYQDRLRRLATPGVSQTNINRTVLLALSIPCPPLPAQRRMASILSSVDDTIEKTQAVIGQLMIVKQGLINKLLTEGMPGQGGEHWKHMTLDSLADVRRGASPRPIQDSKWFSENGPGWVRIVDVSRSDRVLQQTEQRLSAEGVERSVLLSPGDLIMSIAGTIGKPIILGISACIHDGFVWFSRLSPDIEVRFLYYFLQWHQASFQKAGQPGTQKNLNTSLVGQAEVRLPPLSEQRAIAEYLWTIDDRISEERNALAGYVALKRVLLDVLLLGKVRVSARSQEVA